MDILKNCLLVGLTSSLILVGCASRPDSISASYVSHEKYEQKTCSELAILRADARTDLATITAKQNTKANWDAAMVFLVLIPVSQLTGDYKADIANFKGEIEAIETAQSIKGC